MGILGKGFGGIMKVPKHRKFNYQPMYYDADKERLDQRKASIAREVELEEQLKREGKDPSLREAMEMNWSRNYRRKTIFQSNIRLVIIFVLLVIVFWLYLMGA